MKSMIVEWYQKVKQQLTENKSDLYLAAIIFLIGMGGFGLGRLSAIWPEKEPIRITNPGTYNTKQDKIDSDGEKATVSAAITAKGKYVASKSGTAYHYPWCPGAMKIKEENKIWFENKEDAEKAGYKPAGNCAGLTP